MCVFFDHALIFGDSDSFGLFCCSSPRHPLVLCNQVPRFLLGSFRFVYFGVIGNLQLSGEVPPIVSLVSIRSLVFLLVVLLT